MEKKVTIQQIVQEKFPDADVMLTADTGATTSRHTDASARKAPSIRDIKKRLGIQQAVAASVTDAVTGPATARRKAAVKKGPSGIARLLPKNTDGGTRRFTKTVIVSKGKVIALQG